MPYLKILVADSTYHGKEALTYQSNSTLSIGQIVVVPLKNERVTGVVIGECPKPTFAVKMVADVPGFKPLPGQVLDLLIWMQSYYPAPLGVIAQHFLPHSFLKKTSLKISTEKPAVTKASLLPPLTIDQKKALAKIQDPGLHILHGETGTGKTRVYIELAKTKLLEGRSSIILTPEISLTSQLANEFRRALGYDVVRIIHSQLSRNTRQQLWTEILQADSPLIIIGPRSALFAPIKNVGLIVVDESHETAYKQDKAPYYHATTVSAQLALLHNAILVLGSATPLVTDYYIAEAKGRPIIPMAQIATENSSEKSTFLVVDRRLKEEFSRSKHLSDKLLSSIQETLNRKEQVLLFLNRRGTARIVLCEKCGWQALCPHCDLPLTYHGDTHKLICHTCSYKASNPTNCPDCSNPTIIFKSVGTKAIVDEVAKLFPGAITRRFDTDNLKVDRLETHYDAVRAGDVDILVGTQTLAKGLDLPKLGLVGVINAETSLSFPDFSATERTYQLLTQVLGRIGRGHRATQAVIQSYSPDNTLIEAAITKNWKNFYNKELAERQKFNFPPFCYLLKLTCRRSSKQSVEKTAVALKSSLAAQFPNVRIEGPVASFHEKIGDKYQWQLVVKSRSRKTLLGIIAALPANWSHDIDPTDLL